MSSAIKSLPWPLLAILADGKSYSGEVLGDALGVSRSAIWKMIHQLEAAGLELESQRGSGYRLVKPRELLDQHKILSRLEPAVQSAIQSLTVAPQLGSTNSEIGSAAYRDGDILLAEWQLAGRGRRGREWVSPPASNLYLSIRWGFAEGVSALEGLSLAVGLALAEALEDLGVTGATLKWPNDLWLGERKLGGILIEIAGDAAGECHAVIGVGLNVIMPQAPASAIDQAWTDLAANGFKRSRNELASAVLNRLVPLLVSYQAQGFAHYRAAWLARNALQGKIVQVTGAQSLVGEVVGVSASGALVLEVEGQPRLVNGGEVSVRAQ